MASHGIRFGGTVAPVRGLLPAGPRSHPAFGELEAYHRGGLDAESQEWILDHVAECQDCAILLLYGIIEVDRNGEEGVLRDARIEDAWDRLRPRLSTEHGRDRTLATVLAEAARLPPTRAIELAVAVTRALARLHARGRLLSDLRPENVVVEAGGQIRIVDLGLTPISEAFEVGYGRAAGDALVEQYRFLSPGIRNRGRDRRALRPDHPALRGSGVGGRDERRGDRTRLRPATGAPGRRSDELPRALRGEPGDAHRCRSADSRPSAETEGRA